MHQCTTPKSAPDTLHSLPIPPLVPRTKGVNDACSTSKTRCKYCLFFSASLSWKIFSVSWLMLVVELTCVTLTSKNAVCPGLQKPFAFISNRASSLLFAVNKSKLSPSNGNKWGSDWTFLHTLSSKMVNRSLMLSCLCETNPPFLHDIACFTSKGFPHVHRLGKPFKGRLYRKFTASRNSSLFRLNPCCSSELITKREGPAWKTWH